MRTLWRWMFCLTLSLSGVAYGASTTTIDINVYIPKNAFTYFPLVRTERARIWVKSPLPEYVGGLIEQESCISLTHSRCWDPLSKLDSSRELGVGLLQITKAYTKTGAIRFDTLKDLRKKYPVELNDLSWDNIEKRPDLQVRAGLLLVKDNYEALYSIPDTIERLSMADSAYNGGLGNVKKARMACGLAKGCDPNIWFKNVEKYLPQSRNPIYGNRSPFDINVEHVHLIMQVRAKKYKQYIY